jgi:hypothetical protein
MALWLSSPRLLEVLGRSRLAKCVCLTALPAWRILTTFTLDLPFFTRLPVSCAPPLHPHDMPCHTTVSDISEARPSLLGQRDRCCQTSGRNILKCRNVGREYKHAPEQKANTVGSLYPPDLSMLADGETGRIKTGQEQKEGFHIPDSG